MEARVSARLTAAEGRKFGLVVGGAFVVLGALVALKGHRNAGVALGALGTALAGAGVAIPTLLGPVQRGWMGLARVISKVTTPIVMSIIYFGILTPVGLVRRMIGANALVRPKAGDSYWISRETKPGSMERQF